MVCETSKLNFIEEPHFIEELLAMSCLETLTLPRLTHTAEHHCFVPPSCDIPRPGWEPNRSAGLLSAVPTEHDSVCTRLRHSNSSPANILWRLPTWRLKFCPHMVFEAKMHLRLLLLYGRGKHWYNTARIKDYHSVANMKYLVRDLLYRAMAHVAAMFWERPSSHDMHR